jgi:pimeloyl-ACP methyl ester carboxylesterase
MLFKKYGQEDKPFFILMHGGGLSDWSLTGVTEQLSQQYCVITAIIDGHGEDGATTFLSIEDSARKLIEYIDAECNGRVEAIGGLSLGAQITVEALSQRADIAGYAIIESALVYPIKGTKAFTVPAFKLCYGLISKRWFSKLQAKTLLVSEDQFEKYFEDSCRTSKQSLINITLSNGTYQLKESIRNTMTKALILAGGKELKIMLRSAQKLKEYIPNSKLVITEGMKHGELSLTHPELYVKLVKDFMEH